MYVFDTNSFRVLQNYYPDSFSSFWSVFDNLTDSGKIVSVREVRNELENQIVASWFREWVRSKSSIFTTPSAEETQFVSEIFKVAHFQTLIGNQQRLKGTPVADPWVVAAAHVRDATIVTEERLKPNAAKIPNVCSHFDIPFLNLEGFLAQQSWTF